VVTERRARAVEGLIEDVLLVSDGAELLIPVTCKNGVHHPNPSCPHIDPGDDALPRIGLTKYVDLRTLVDSSGCTWCSNYFSDHGTGTKELTRLLVGPVAFAKFIRGEITAGEAINSLKKNWLISEEFVKKTVELLIDRRCQIDTGLFALVERGGDITKEQGIRLSRGTWHWADGWSIVEHNEFDRWRKGVVLGFETSERARITSKTYAEVTSLVLEDPVEAWLAACVLNK
jgi:hypothetical protein